GDRWRSVEIDAGVRTLAAGAERRDELVVHDLHDHLAGRHRLHHFDADGLFLDAFNERARHIERDVRLEQCTAHLAQCGVDARFAEWAAAGEAVENAAQFFRQRVEHQSTSTFTPEGASRCRAVASGLKMDRAADWNSRLYRERREPRFAMWPSQGRADLRP